MPVLGKDPRKIHPACKEAVVDSLLNGLSARLSGRGEFYRIIYGTKPSAALMSEFIVPMPSDERGGDEEADPIQISAHGLDFQVRSTAAHQVLKVALTGAVYVRILPTEDEIKPGGRLEATFPLTREARADIRVKIREALARLAATLPGGKTSADWAVKSYEARKAVYESMGLPFDNHLDRTPNTDEDAIENDNESPDESETPPIQEVAVSQTTPDRLAEAVPPPAKWLRLDLNLPTFDFTPATAEADANTATEALNSSIAQHLADWAANDDPVLGGKQWGYRRAHPIRPSDVHNWSLYLESVRSSNLAVVLPNIDLRWVIQTACDPTDQSRTTIHVALENWTLPLSKTNFKEIEPALFQVSVSVSVSTADHLFLRLERVKPSYRYNRYLKYPALGFNGGVTLKKEGALHRLTTTWAPRYILPRIIPTSNDVQRNIHQLAQPDCLAGVRPLIAAYEAWLIEVEKHPVDQGLEGANIAEQLAAERGKLLQDLAGWRSELDSIRTGLEILEKSRMHWSGPGVQTSPLGIPFEAWLSMNTAMSKVAKSKGYTEWRLFQLAFILASIPAFATRIPEFHDFYTADVAKNADAVTLLYFATGGGKSEAFLGLLVLILFMDRLRGKHRGVSALMRYPLRLLTLQQARRTFATMGASEEVRHSRGHPGEPFTLGFWVGGSNTPNWHSEDSYNDVPTDTDVAPDAEPDQRDVQPYKSARERWLKLTSCPFCQSKDGSLLALRRHSGNGGNALGHYCTTPAEKCSWNARHVQPTPLPFYIVDEDIYDLAPSVLLGTVDKLAAIGQSQGTIRKRVLL